MTAMFTVVRGPGTDAFNEGSEVSFQVDNDDSPSRDSSVVAGIIADLAARGKDRVDFHLTNDAGVRVAWINNYHPGLQTGGYGERI